MSTHVIQKILEGYPKRNIKVATGFESAIVGYDKFSNSIIYSAKKCVSILTVKDKLSIAEANSHLKECSKGGNAIYIDDVNDILDINLN
tara:strand:- start:3 stop:269 length:267 start_codon:yes stop_codon:yes gene_type:complete